MKNYFGKIGSNQPNHWLSSSSESSILLVIKTCPVTTKYFKNCLFVFLYVFFSTVEDFSPFKISLLPFNYKDNNVCYFTTCRLLVCDIWKSYMCHCYLFNHYFFNFSNCKSQKFGWAWAHPLDPPLVSEEAPVAF